jgi:predicted small secreted protein
MFNCGLALATGTSVLQYQYILRKKVKQEEEAIKTLQEHE